MIKSELIYEIDNVDDIEEIDYELLSFSKFILKKDFFIFGDKLFDRLMIASVACTADFEHRIYNRNMSADCG